MDFTVSRGKAFLVVVILWALIYLPGLGREGLKGEEGRRVLPAVEMIKTHNWILPRIGGKDYYSKPPGINWLVATSFVLTGQQTELTARLPSVAFVLIFVTLLIWLPNPWMSVSARLISSIIFLTNIALIEKGRLIEIEAVYISLTGIAILLWLNIWFMNGPRWLLWLMPSIVMAFGMLVKGPFIIIFFYSVAISVLCYSKKFKSLFSIWNFIGAGLIIFSFLGWFYMASKMTNASKMSTQMEGQLLMRIFGGFDLYYWGQNVVRAFFTFLPWLLFLPMLWDKSLVTQIEERSLPLFKGCRLGMIIGFGLIIIMPKMEARYSMPAIPIASMLLGWILSLRAGLIKTDYLWKGILIACLVIACMTGVAGVLLTTWNLSWFSFKGLEERSIAASVAALIAAVTSTYIVIRRRNEIQNILGLTLVTALVFFVGMMQYTSYGLDIITSGETRRPAAIAINKAVPAGETIYIFKPISYLYPTVFTLRPPVDYVLDANDVNGQMRYLLIKSDDLKMLEEEKKIAGGKTLYELSDRIPGDFRLVQTSE
jgi:4-amino-4-deoxy-L-arabinose transferase-like glycosyltransferase